MIIIPPKEADIDRLRRECSLFHHVTVQECDNLGAGAGGIGTEGVRRRAAGDLFANSPKNCIIVVTTRLYIFERVAVATR